MSQLVDSNEVYSAVDLDKNGAYKKFGAFHVKTLNDLQIKHSSLPGITDPQLPSTALPGYGKVVGNIETFGTRLNQTESEISLLAVDVDNAQSQLTIQAGEISALVSDVDENYSLIQQNVSNINLKVSKNEVITQINLSPEGVYIEGDNIQLNGNTQVLGSFSVTDIADAGNLATKDNVGSSDVTFNYASSSSKGGRYNAWLTSNELTSGSNPYNGVVMDSAGIRGYGAGAKNFEIQASTGDVYLRGEIDASGGSIYGDFYVTGSGVIIVGFGTTYVEITPGTSGPGLYFTDGGTYAGGLIGNSSIPVSVGGLSTTLNGVEITKSLVVDVDLFVKDDLIVADDFYLGGLVASDLKMGGSADIYLTSTSNRIYGSDNNSYIYFTGSVWRVKDTVNGVFTLAP